MESGWLTIYRHRLVLIFGDPDNGESVGDIDSSKVHVICRKFPLKNNCTSSSNFMMLPYLGVYICWIGWYILETGGNASMDKPPPPSWGLSSEWTVTDFWNLTRPSWWNLLWNKHCYSCTPGLSRRFFGRCRLGCFSSGILNLGKWVSLGFYVNDEIDTVGDRRSAIVKIHWWSSENSLSHT